MSRLRQRADPETLLRFLQDAGHQDPKLIPGIAGRNATFCDGTIGSSLVQVDFSIEKVGLTAGSDLDRNERGDGDEAVEFDARLSMGSSLSPCRSSAQLAAGELQSAMSLAIDPKRFPPPSSGFSSLSVPLLIFVGLLLLSGCAGAPRKINYGLGYREVGLASWYGKDFHGKPTSSGEIYNMFGLSAAHQTLPLGTDLRVTELRSGRSVRVRVNDRGPFVGNRILDLSYGAAKALGIIEEGTADVEIEIVGFSPNEDVFLVQVGSYRSKESALRIKEKVGQYYKAVYVETIKTDSGPFHRVRIGPLRSERDARAIVGRLPKQLAPEPLEPVVIRGN